MTPAEFYVSSDALVHLQISTEYLSKRCTCLQSGGVKVQQIGNASAKG